MLTILSHNPEAVNPFGSSELVDTDESGILPLPLLRPNKFANRDGNAVRV